MINQSRAFSPVTTLEKYKSRVNIEMLIALSPIPKIVELIILKLEDFFLIISNTCSLKEKIKIVFAKAITKSCQIIKILNVTHL